MIARKLLAVSAALVMGAAGLTACSGDDGDGGGGESRRHRDELLAQLHDR